MGKQLTDGSIFRRKGVWFRVKHEYDGDVGPPQKHADGHGPVEELRGTYETDDELRAKGYLVLSRTRYGVVIVYGYKEALRIAQRDGWARGKSPSAKRRAVMRDYEFLRGWYQDDWTYIGVTVERITGPQSKVGHKASLWGIESNADKYLTQVARELADEVIAQ